MFFRTPKQSEDKLKHEGRSTRSRESSTSISNNDSTTITTSASTTTSRITRKNKISPTKPSQKVKVKFNKETITIHKPSSSTTIPIAEKLSDHCSFDLTKTSKNYVIFPSTSFLSSSSDNQTEESPVKSPIGEAHSLSNEDNTSSSNSDIKKNTYQNENEKIQPEVEDIPKNQPCSIKTIAEFCDENQALNNINKSNVNIEPSTQDIKEEDIIENVESVVVNINENQSSTKNTSSAIDTSEIEQFSMDVTTEIRESELSNKTKGDKALSKNIETPLTKEDIIEETISSYSSNSVTTANIEEVQESCTDKDQIAKLPAADNKTEMQTELVWPNHDIVLNNASNKKYTEEHSTPTNDEPRRSGRKRSTKSFGDDTIVFPLKKEKPQTLLKVDIPVKQDTSKTLIAPTRSSERKRLVSSKYRGEDIYTPKSNKMIIQEKSPVIGERRRNSSKSEKIQGEKKTVEEKPLVTGEHRRNSLKLEKTQAEKPIHQERPPVDAEHDFSFANQTEDIKTRRSSKSSTVEYPNKTEIRRRSSSKNNPNEQQTIMEDKYEAKLKQTETHSLQTETHSVQTETHSLQTETHSLQTASTTNQVTKDNAETTLKTEEAPREEEEEDVTSTDLNYASAEEHLEEVENIAMAITNDIKGTAQEVLSTEDSSSVPHIEEPKDEEIEIHASSKVEEPFRLKETEASTDTVTTAQQVKKNKSEKPVPEKAASKNFEQKYELFKQKWKAEKEKRRLMKEKTPMETNTPIRKKTQAVSPNSPAFSEASFPTPDVQQTSTLPIQQTSQQKCAPISLAQLSTIKDTRYKLSSDIDQTLTKKDRVHYSSQQGIKTGPTLTQLVASKIHKKAQAHQKQRQEADLERKTPSKNEEEIDLTAITLCSLKSPPKPDEKSLNLKKKKSLDFITGRLKYKKKMEMLKAQSGSSIEGEKPYKSPDKGPDYFNLQQQSPPAKDPTTSQSLGDSGNCLTSPVRRGGCSSIKSALKINVSGSAASNLTTPTRAYIEQGLVTPDKSSPRQIGKICCKHWYLYIFTMWSCKKKGINYKFVSLMAIG